MSENSVVGRAMNQMLVLVFALTACGGVAQGDVVLETGFEGPYSLPVGWSQSQVSGGATWTIQSGGRGRPAAANSGYNNATLFRSNTGENKTRLTSPLFDTNGYTTVTLSFYHAQPVWIYEGSQDQDELKVFYSGDGGSNWTELAHYTDNTPNWTQRTLSLPTTSANSQIAFEGNARYGYGASLDDIVVTGSPSLKSTFSITTTDDDASEDGPNSGTWTITRSGNTTGSLSLDYILSGTATAGLDYTVDTPSPISFTAGQTSVAITITPVDDAVVAENDESATLTLEADAAYFIDNASADIPISDNDLADLNILILGSDRSFSESGESSVVHEKPFNPAGIASHLKEIIDQHQLITDSANVVHDSIFNEKTQIVNYSGSSTYSFTSRCYSLAQHYMWPEGKDERLADLRGEGDTEWDYIVLSFDPYILANFPGMVAEGVKLIQEEVSRSAKPAQVVLLAQWPENSSTFSADDFNEVVYRTGNSAGLPVVPAGKAWDSLPSQDTNAAHPTPNGEYLAAAAIYSWLYDNSASSSNYTYVDASTTSAIADHALSVVQANDGASQYSGDYTAINPFKMKYVDKRVVNFRETGTSTEDGIRFALNRLDDVQRITFSTSGYAGGTGTRWDFNYGRGNDQWENDKDYEVDPNKYDRSYGFPMHHYTTSNAPITMPYGIDKHYQYGISYEDGTDLGIAYNMIRPNTRELSLPEDVRAVPIRLMWLKMREVFPGFNPLGDSTHMNNHLNDATAAFMYTLLSGRCPVVEEPATQGSTEWQQWLGHKIGYETAWQMSHLTTRAPGFRVLPSSTSATTVTPTSTEIMTVQFVNPPQSDVTVDISLSNNSAAIVGPQKLVFTPENYDTPQNVTVAGIQGAAASEVFDVVFNTTSNDGVYDELSDSWEYTMNRSSPQSLSAVDKGTILLTAFRDTPKTVDINTTGANSGNTEFAGPNNGTLTWSGTDVIYTPNAGFTGKDGFAFAVNDNGVLSTGVIEIDVLDEAAVGTVSYNGNGSDGGSVPFDSNTYSESDTVTVLGNTEGLVKTGHSFSGWNTESDGSGASYTAGGTFSMGATGVILFARWTPDTYTISYDANDANGASSGSTPSDQTKTFGVDLLVFGNTGGLARTGYKFVGWNTAANGSGQSFAAGATFTLEQNTTLYAQWNASPVVDAGADQSATLSGSVAWSPADISTVAWYDASDAATITESGGAVSQWNDKSGNGNHATQGNGGNQPTYNGSDSRLKNLPTIGYDQGFRYLQTTSLAAIRNVYVVTYYDDPDNSFDSHRVLFSDTGNSVKLQGQAGADDWVAGKGFNHFKNGATSSSDLNILPMGPTLWTAKGTASHTNKAWRLLSGTNNYQYWEYGAIGEIILTDGTEDLATQQKIEGYLAHQWGMAADLALDHPHKSTSPGGPSAVVNLDGTVSDLDSASVTQGWTGISGPGSVNFGDASAVDTTASFSEAGTYVLRLTADDGYSQTFNEVTITVADAQSFAGWISGYDLGGQTAPGDDFDGDGIPNAVENYFGTNPGIFNAGLSATQVTTGGSTTFAFSHPMSGNPAADMTVLYRWSKDLSSFHNHSETDLDGTKVDFVAGTPADGEVTVTATITGTEAVRLFVRVEASLE